MNDGRSPFTQRVLDAIRADERRLAARRRSVMSGVAALVVILGLWFLVRDDGASSPQPDRERWLAVLSGTPSAIEDDGGSGDAKLALHELARLYLVEGDEVAGEAVIAASRRSAGRVDLFGVLAAAAREDRVAALARARTMMLLREVDVASLSPDWDTLLAGLDELSDEDEIWCVLFYLESFSPSDAAPYVSWVGSQLGHSSDEIRVRALQTLRRLAPIGIENALVAMLQSGTVREKQVALIVAADLDLAAETTPAVLGVLGDPEPTVRLRAVRTLAHFGDPANAAAVGALASDGELAVRIHGALAAAQLGDTQHVGMLVPIAQGTLPTDCVQTLSSDPVNLALIALGELGDPRAADAAEAHLTDFLSGVTQEKDHVLPSLLALEQLHRTTAIPLVMSLEELGDTGLWIQAAATLHSLGSSSGALILNTYFFGPDEGLRTQAINAAARLRDEIFREDFEDLQGHESQQTRDAADRAIDRLDEPDNGS